MPPPLGQVSLASYLQALLGKSWVIRVGQIIQWAPSLNLLKRPNCKGGWISSPKELSAWLNNPEKTTMKTNNHHQKHQNCSFSPLSHPQKKTPNKPRKVKCQPLRSRLLQVAGLQPGDSMPRTSWGAERFLKRRLIAWNEKTTEADFFGFFKGFSFFLLLTNKKKTTCFSLRVFRTWTFQWVFHITYCLVLSARNLFVEISIGSEWSWVSISAGLKSKTRTTFCQCHRLLTPNATESAHSRRNQLAETLKSVSYLYLHIEFDIDTVLFCTVSIEFQFSNADFSFVSKTSLESFPPNDASETSFLPVASTKSRSWPVFTSVPMKASKIERFWG